MEVDYNVISNISRTVNNYSSDVTNVDKQAAIEKDSGIKTDAGSPLNGSSVELSLEGMSKSPVSTVEKETDASENEALKEALSKAVDGANKAVRPYNRSFEISIHEKTNKVLVKVIDRDTDEVIRELPPEVLLDSYAKMLELAGLLYDGVS